MNHVPAHGQLQGAQGKTRGAQGKAVASSTQEVGARKEPRKECAQGKSRARKLAQGVKEEFFSMRYSAMSTGECDLDVGPFVATYGGEE